MKEQKTLSNWLTTKYILIIKNEEDFAEKRNYQFTYAKLIAIIVSLFILIFTLAVFSVSTILSKWFDPRFAQRKQKMQLIELSSKVDSLEYQNQMMNEYLLTFKKMLDGGDTEVKTDQTPLTKNYDIDKLSPVDEKIRNEFEGDEEFDVQLVSNSSSVENAFFTHLFKPIDGIVIEDYSPDNEHFAVDIVAKNDEPVKTVAAGTVILASWTDDTGYVIGVQHENNLISFYKHNSVLLKKLGDYVQAGDIISIIGNSGDLTTGPHLHFELWINGNPVNPKNYISL